MVVDEKKERKILSEILKCPQKNWFFSAQVEKKSIFFFFFVNCRCKIYFSCECATRTLHFRVRLLLDEANNFFGISSSDKC